MTACLNDLNSTIRLNCINYHSGCHGNNCQNVDDVLDCALIMCCSSKLKYKSQMKEMFYLYDIEHGTLFKSLQNRDIFCAVSQFSPSIDHKLISMMFNYYSTYKNANNMVLFI